MTKNKLPSDSELKAKQKILIDQLSEVDISRIDQALLSNASAKWAHTDRIVLTTMIELDNGMGLPILYFVERMEHLVNEGLLESKGDLTSMHSSEVRLKQ